MQSMNSRRSMLILLIVSGLIISICMGLRQSFGLFMRPITLELGVSAAAFGFSVALQNIVWGLGQPVVGAIADRFGARPVLVVTSVIYALGLMMITFARGELGLDIAGFMMGVGVAGTGFGILIGVVTRSTPPERRSQTVGAVAAMGSLGTIVIAPLGQMLVDGMGWRAGIMGFAAIAMLMMVLSFAIREPVVTDGPKGSGPPQSLREALVIAWRHRGFLAMTTAYFACGFQLIFITTHLPQYLELCGQAPSLGAAAMALIGLFNTIGTYSIGLMGARYSQKRLLALIYLFRTIAIAAFIYFPVTPTTTLVFASVMGLLWLGVAPLVTVIVSRMFGLLHFNMLYGLAFLWHQVGSFFGAWIGGAVFDWTGRYDWAWIALIVIGAIAFTLQWRMDDRPAEAHRPASAAMPA
jgi:predicted MFS family arabinose efflux permease